MINNWGWSAIKILNECFSGINSKVMINRREKIAWSTNAIISIFTALIGRTNKLTGFQKYFRGWEHVKNKKDWFIVQSNTKDTDVDDEEAS